MYGHLDEEMTVIENAIVYGLNDPCVLHRQLGLNDSWGLNLLYQYIGWISLLRLFHLQIGSL